MRCRCTGPGVQDFERIGKLRDRYWGIDMFIESTGSIGTAPDSCRIRYFQLERPLRGEFALVGVLPISCNIQALTPPLDMTIGHGLNRGVENKMLHITYPQRSRLLSSASLRERTIMHEAAAVSILLGMQFILFASRISLIYNALHALQPHRMNGNGWSCRHDSL